MFQCFCGPLVCILHQTPQFCQVHGFAAPCETSFVWCAPHPFSKWFPHANMLSIWLTLQVATGFMIISQRSKPCALVTDMQGIISLLLLIAMLGITAASAAPAGDGRHYLEPVVSCSCKIAHDSQHSNMLAPYLRQYGRRP